MGVGRSDPALRGLNDYASAGSGPVRHSDAQDSELLVFSRRDTGRLTIIAGWQHPFFLANGELFGAWFDLLRPLFLDNDPLQKTPLREPASVACD